jgi:hypothetical protein
MPQAATGFFVPVSKAILSAAGIFTTSHVVALAELVQEMKKTRAMSCKVLQGWLQGWGCGWRQTWLEHGCHASKVKLLSLFLVAMMGGVHELGLVEYM